MKVKGITSQRCRSTILSIDECRLFSVNLVQCIIILEPHLSTAYSWRFLLPPYPVGNVRSYNDAWLSSRERSEIRLGFGLVWFDAERPGKQFFSHVGTEPSLPVYNRYFFFFFLGGGGGGGICLAQGHNTATRVGFEPPTSGSRVRGINHDATAPPSGSEDKI